jgi:hypothetical protein
MIHYNIKFQPYDWEVEVYVIVNNCFIEEILASMKDCPESEIQQAFLNLTTRINSGFIRTFDRRSIIVINKPTTIEEFINVYNHEKNHLEMHICEEFGIDPHSEEAAELSGMLAKCLYSSLVDELLQYYTEIYNR